MNVLLIIKTLINILRRKKNIFQRYIFRPEVYNPYSSRGCWRMPLKGGGSETRERKREKSERKRKEEED
jgi:hypothetical protein